MTPSEIRSALITHWRDNYSETPTWYENQEFGNRAGEDKTNPYVMFDIVFAGSRTVIKGAGTETRHTGYLNIVIKVPVVSGTKRLYEIADVAASVLERQRISGGISTRASELTDLGPKNENYSLVVRVPFVVN